MNEVQQSTVLLNEEIAGPVAAIGPARLRDRISSIDVLRGVALLGILMLNIDDFGNTSNWAIPIGTTIDYFSGPHAHLNLFVLLMKWIFFEGKMRGIFSMLFGAGVILLTGRAERRGAASEIADIYTRRNMLLVLFGVLHICFIWDGDILFDYGLMALVFLYPCRRMNAKALLWIGTILSLAAAPLSFPSVKIMRDVRLSHQAAAITAQEKAGKPITAADREVLHKWQQRVDDERITPKKIQERVHNATLGYWASVAYRAHNIFGKEFSGEVLGPLLDILSAMLLGMGLMKIGFFTAELPYATYLWTMLIGFGISAPLYSIALWKIKASGFFFLTCDTWFYMPYYITREAGSLAIAATVMVIVKAGLLRWPQRLLEAVGRTALSNYLLTSVLCQTIFVWGPWKLFGKLEFYQLLYVVFGVWAVNLILSSLWLRWFAFGPVEWLWRSLTYFKLQPMRLQKPVAAEVATA